jgi:hypothetical protein
MQRTKTFNTELETTVTFVNRDGKTGNYVNTVTPAPETITLRDTFVQLPDNNFKTKHMMLVLHTTPIPILIIVLQ